MTTNNTDTDIIDPELEAYMKRLLDLAFNQHKKAGPLLKEVHHLIQIPENKPYFDALCTMREWLVIPNSFWRRDFVGMTKFLVELVRARKPLDARFKLLIKYLDDYPPKLAQNLVALHEHKVMEGKYDDWVICDDKYKAYELRLLKNKWFWAEWAEIKSLFNVDEYRNPAGIIRRDVVCERNFKSSDWEFDWSNDEAQFYEIFTAFCAKRFLWGMEGDHPLLLKLTVHMTPFGLMTMFPPYLNIDSRNDLNWKTLTKLLKALGAESKGADRLAEQGLREDEAIRIHEADECAGRLGLQGPKRFDYIRKMAELPPTYSDRKIRLRLALARKLLGVEEETSERKTNPAS